MKICFVGIHHKEGKTPLDSSTSTGKIIDRIIQGLGPRFECQKKNLFPTYKLPSQGFRDRIACRFTVENGVFYVLLGHVVGTHFPAQWVTNHLKVFHPGYAMRNGSKYVESYILETTQSILNCNQ